jgi:hypothetical protein
MKQLFVIFILSITVFSQSYLYDKEYAISPMAAASASENSLTLSSGLTIVLFGRIDLYAGFSASKGFEANKTIDVKTFGLSYEVISNVKHQLSLGYGISSVGWNSYQANHYNVNYALKRKENAYFLASLAYSVQEAAYNNSIQIIGFGIGGSFKVDLKNVVFAFEPSLTIAIPEASEISIAFSLSIITSIPFL